MEALIDLELPWNSYGHIKTFSGLYDFRPGPFKLPEPVAIAASIL